jgi:hypothetical protein
MKTSAPCPRLHPRQGGAGQVVGGAEVDVEDARPVLGRGVRDAALDAGADVEMQHVEGAVGAGLGHGGGGGLSVGHVALEGARARRPRR